ncbi:MAG: type VI secretion system baseplate subunit TssF [Azoarcus sp.]|jgi:type VI secretion system protein ImpG|nr:type VI secretion system baseplate subunit TssF [Azoarcus sp.]
MDARFLDYYNRELAYLRELGAEFSASFPKVAGHLGMREGTVADPYVERLLEGFAFLAARIHLKMDAEFPRFSQRLLEIVYPHYLAPTPAMAIAKIPLDPAHDAQKSFSGFLPRGTTLESAPAPGTPTSCTFVTAHDLEAWPLSIVEARAGMPVKSVAGLPRFHDKPPQGEIRLRLKYRAQVTPGQPHPDRLVFFISAKEVVATHIFEAIVGHCVGVSVTSPDSGSVSAMLPASALRAEGFGTDQALLPTDPRVFQGYRLLHEYFAFPQRFLFFSINGLKPILTRLGKEVFDLTVLIDQEAGSLAESVHKGCFELDCVPIINVFKQQAIRLNLTHAGTEQHVVPDRTRPRDFEVYRIDTVQGFDRGNKPLSKFAPFYHYSGGEVAGDDAWFTTRRESRRLSETSRRSGARSSYAGSEVFLSLIDSKENPWPEKIAQLSMSMLLTNRDLPLLIPINTERDLTVGATSSMNWGRIISGPSRPRLSIAEREMTWRIISHLSLNYLAMRDMSPESGAEAMRGLLGLYAAFADSAAAKQSSSIVSVESSSVTRRLPVSGPLVFGRGVQIKVTLDEILFEGASPYLFGCVLEQFLSRHVSMNSFCELSLHGAGHRPIAVWPPRLGGRPDA